MKKLILIVITLLISITMFSCSTERFTTTTVDPMIQLRADSVDYIVTFIQRFGDVEDSDLVYDFEETVFVGSANVVLAEKNSSVNKVIIEEGKQALIEFVLSEGDSLNLYIWNVMITYVNPSKEIYVYLDYYHYGKIFVPNYKDEILSITFRNFVEKVSYLTIEDVEKILIRLNYNVLQ